MSGRDPVLWIDISTVRGWRGTPHGIARVEAGIATALAQRLPRARAAWMDGRDLTLGAHADLLSLTDGGNSSTPGFDVGQTVPSWADPSVRRAVTSLGIYGRKARLASGLHFAISTLPDGVGVPVMQAVRRFQDRRSRHHEDRAQSTLDPRLSVDDVVLVTGADWDSGVVPTLAQVPRSRRPHLHVLVHDLSPVIHPELLCNDLLVARFTEWIATVAGTVDHLFFVSRQSRDDFIAFASHHGMRCPPSSIVAPAVWAQDQQEIAIPPGRAVQEPFVVYVSTIERRKNHVVLLQAVRSALRRGETLPTVVLVGSWGWGTDDLRQELLRDRDLADHVIQFGGLPDPQMRWLVENAAAVVFPSRFEGYGMPVAEARALGRPVIAADLPALREILGRGARYLDPDDAGAWREALADVARGVVPQAARSTTRTWSDVAAELVPVLGVRRAAATSEFHGGGSPGTPET